MGELRLHQMEMRQKAGARDSLFVMKRDERPMSVATEFVDMDWDEDLMSEMEENSPRHSVNSVSIAYRPPRRAGRLTTGISREANLALPRCRHMMRHLHHDTALAREGTLTPSGQSRSKAQRDLTCSATRSSPTWRRRPPC